MKPKIQGLRMTLNDIEHLKREIEESQKELNKELKIKRKIDKDQKNLIMIVNKTPICSDTWELKL
jgi:ABC-type uncharacterized transport system substrate-binding protein